MKKMYHFILISGILAGSPAEAEGQVATNIQYTDRMFMRGEQISESAIEASITMGAETPLGDVYAGVYRLTPIGERKSYFFEEFDYTLGYIHKGEAFSVNLSASLLRFPGSQYDSMLELVGRSSFDMWFQPTLIGFYNDGLGNAGLEITAGPQKSFGAWTLYGLGRAGFVTWRHDVSSRTYAGVEMGTTWSVSGPLQLQVGVRHEVANQDSYLEDILDGGILQSTDSGTSLRVSLSTAF